MQNVFSHQTSQRMFYCIINRQ